MGDVDDNHNARLTTWLVEQRRWGIQKPEITWDIINKTKAASNMRASERTDRILKFLAAKTKKVGYVRSNSYCDHARKSAPIPEKVGS